jgi:hypothetical protein
VQRTLYVKGTSGKTVKLPPVRVNADGTYTFTDTPASAGKYSYLASYAGDGGTGPAQATHQIIVK